MLDAVTTANADQNARANFALAVSILTIQPEGGPRRLHAEKQLQTIGLSGTFIQGFSKNDPQIMSEYTSVKNLLFSKRDLTLGEIAVYCGHRAIWRNFLESDAKHLLVMEDDFVVLDPRKFIEALADCLDKQSDWGMVKFFDYRPKRVRRRKQLNATEIVQYKYAASGAVCYLINRQTAENFLKRKRFFRAVDEDFSWGWELGLDVWSVTPNLMADGSETLGGSLLQDDRLAKKKQRNLPRSFWANLIQAYKLTRSLTS
ncbi:glycosyltransferase family 25 protein [Limoniibacter endophyticus]|uniref:Glycosyl transferase family 25 domain-containing protein n=1 Tax=Limoniibacter endophyticus TaxID=1565040 RepID=A0A8J3GG74_9HYPH|nr:glycosyltransferase family 25 protein [Limoniibacter endophyticus]GHC62967.1 hypothetical protein GCM10010136_04360 [Limoniibacter endophyticus]